MTGWRVQQITNGSSTSKSFDGPLLSIQMPQCTRLVVTPVLEAASGIKTLTTPSPTSGIVYNLSGQRLSKSRKGVNIIGGHKIVVK